MFCEQVMTKHKIAVSTLHNVGAAARVMRDQHVSFLPVCDLAGRIAGTITDHDITVRIAACGGAPETLLRKVMTVDVITCGPEDDLACVEQLMIESRKS